MSSTSEKTASSGSETKNGFQIPKWAGKPPNGLHLDVMKESKMIQKLMIDEKNCYFFGRNKDTVDFCVDHASCSRVHAALVWHKHLNRSFIVDLGSAHGTHIGSIRLDANKPQQVFIDSELKFGASTRTYIIRERPQANKHFPSMLANNTNPNSSLNDSISKEDTEDYHNSSLNSGLPETEAELDNLTEFNTANNKRISQLVDNKALNPTTVKKKKKSVSICDEEDVINPEDIDPSIGRFRNMIQTTVFIPNIKKRPNQMQISQQAELINKRTKQDDESIPNNAELYSESESEEEFEDETEGGEQFGTTQSLGINLAPDVDDKETTHNESEIIIKKQQYIQQHQQQMINKQHQQTLQLQREQLDQEKNEMHKKKKYVKEAWPGRKPINPISDQISVSISNVSSGLPSKMSSAGLPSNLPTAKTVSPNKTNPPQQMAPKRLLI